MGTQIASRRECGEGFGIYAWNLAVGCCRSSECIPHEFLPHGLAASVSREQKTLRTVCCFWSKACDWLPAWESILQQC